MTSIRRTAGYPSESGIVSKYFNNSPNPGYDLFYSKASVKHLREAMPFDKITVKMAIKSIPTKGIKIYFEYYKSKIQ